MTSPPAIQPVLLTVAAMDLQKMSPKEIAETIKGAGQAVKLLNQLAMQERDPNKADEMIRAADAVALLVRLDLWACGET